MPIASADHLSFFRTQSQLQSLFGRLKQQFSKEPSVNIDREEGVTTFVGCDRSLTKWHLVDHFCGI